MCYFAFLGNYLNVVYVLSLFSWMSQVNVALDVIRKNDVSAAIFAPGWVYETKQPPNFETAQNR